MKNYEMLKVNEWAGLSLIGLDEDGKPQYVGNDKQFEYAKRLAEEVENGELDINDLKD